MKLRLPVVLMVLSAFGVAGCGSSDDGPAPVAPDGVSCASVVGAKDASAATSALAGAAAGTCVVLTGTSYGDAAFDVKAGVTLAGQKGARPTLSQAKQNGNAVVVLHDGAALANVDVADAPAVGAFVLGAHATIRDVTITGAKNAALTVRCDGGCDAGAVALDDVALEKSYVGFIAVGAHVTMTGGRIGENGTTSLTSGLGLVATGGAHVELDGTVVEKNGGTGIVVDGDKTSLSAKNAKVLDNAERGVWAQGAAGTLDAPAVRLEATEVARNKIVGVGALETHGIIVVGGRVAETVAAPVVTNLATTEQVGDGVGVFSGSGDLKIDGTLIEANARAAGIIDGSDRGIIVVGGRVTPGPSGLKFVVQSSSADIQIADDLKSVPDKVLGVSASKIAVPTLVGP